MRLTRRPVVAAVAAAATLGLARCLGVAGGSDVERRETLTRPVDGATALTATNADGDVSVGTHGGDAVLVDVTKRGPSERAVGRVGVETRREDGTLVVETDAPERSTAGASVHLDVRVPAGLAVARAGTVNGDATVRGTAGDAVVAATNGDATAADVDGFVTLRTVNGDVTATETAGFAGASAVNGDVDVEVRAIRSDAAAETTNGEVNVAVAGTLDADVAADTSNGSIAVDGVDLTDPTGGRRRVTGLLNDGGPRLRARAATGRVSLRPLDT